MQSEDSKSIGTIITELTDSFKHLVRSEIALAKLEVRSGMAKLGGGAGLLAAAGLFAFFAFALLLTAAVAALALVLPVWASAVIVAVVLLIIAAILGMMGKKKVQNASPVPTAAIQNMKTDAAAIKSEIASNREKR